VLRDFRDFAARGNVIDLAVGVIIGAAFGKVVASLVSDLIMPPIGLAIGRVNFRDLFIPLNGGQYASLAEAQAAAAPTLNYGLFINNIIEFLIVAFAVFLMVRQINRLRPPAPAVDELRPCPYCVSNVSVKARRCAFCTSELPARPI
jgi:large conductance mechanosensitive channel